MVVYNESNVNIQLQWGSFTAYCPAWMAMLYCLQTPNVNINWSQLSTLPVPAGSSSPISTVIVETYESYEAIVGTFPAPLVRQVNIGNSTPLSTNTTAVVNDGATAGTSIVESTVSGDSGSAVQIKNNAVVTMGTSANPGSLSLINGGFTIDGNNNVAQGTIGHPGSISFIHGLFTIDNLGNIAQVATIQFNIASNQIIYRAAGGGSVILDAHDDKNLILNAGNVGGGGKVYLQVGGVNKASVDSSGNMRIAGTLTQNTTP